MGYRAQRLAALLNEDRGWQATVAYLTFSDPPTRSERPRGLLRLLHQIQGGKYDVVYIIDIGPYHFALLLAARLCGKAHVIIDQGDLVGAISRKSGRSLLMSWIFHLCQTLGEHWARTVVVRSSYHRDLLLERDIAPVLHIPDGVEPDLFGPRDVSQLRRELGLEGSFTVGMSGSMRQSYLYGYDVVEVVHRLQNLPVKGVVIGGWGEGLEAVKRRAESLRIATRIVFTGPIYDAEERCAHLNLIDVCLLTRLDELWSRVVTTGKLPEYLACERYTIGSDVGEVGRILKTHDCGHALPIDSDLADYYDRVARHIHTLFDDQTRIAAVGKQGRALVLEMFSYRVLAARFAKYIDGEGPDKD